MVTQQGARWSRRSSDDTAARYIQEARIHTAEGRLPAAELACLESLRRKGREQDEELATILNLLGNIRLEKGENREARRCGLRALDVAAALAEPGVDRDVDRQRVRALCLIGRSYIAQEQYKEARPLLERALALVDGCLEPVSEEKCQVLVALGWLSQQAGHFHEAEESYRQALSTAERVYDPYHGEVASICYRLSTLADLADDAGVLESHGRRAWEIRCSLFGSTHPLTAAAQAGLAAVLDACGEAREAGEKFLYSMAIFDRYFTSEQAEEFPISPDLLRDYAFCRAGAVRHLVADGRFDDARDFSRRMLAVAERVLGRRHPLAENCRREHQSLTRSMPFGGGRKVRYSAWEWWRSLAGLESRL